MRTVATVKNHQIRLDVADAFEDGEVEVIIVPIRPQHRPPSRDKRAFLKFLQQGPTLSEEELRQIETVQRELKTWTIQEF